VRLEPLWSAGAAAPDEVALRGHSRNEGVVATLAKAREREKSEDDLSHQARKRLVQLPALLGHTLNFVWDVETVGSERCHCITMSGELVWRETARHDDAKRFNQVKQLLKRNYGHRFASLTPTDAAAVTLLDGDALATLTLT